MAHPYLDFLISVTDLHSVDWTAVLRSAKRKSWSAYFDAMKAALISADQRGDDIERKVFALLTEVTRFNVDYSSRNPFSVSTRWNGFSTPDPTDLSKEQLAVLREIADTPSDSEFRSHVEDILWCVSRDVKAARNAILFYEQTAADLNSQLDWYDRLDRFGRALVISIQIKDRAATIRISAALESAIVTHSSDPEFPSELVINLLLQHGFGTPSHYALVVETMANDAETSGAFLVAKDRWTHVAAWRRKEGNKAAAEAALIKAASALYSEAFGPRGMGKAVPDPLYASGHLTNAIELFRVIPGQKQRVSTLIAELLEVQRGIPARLETITTSALDIRSLQRTAIASVTGVDAVTAILRFCLVADVPEKAALEKRAQGNFHGMFADFFETNYINQAGRTVARKDPTFSRQGASTSGALEAATFGYANQEWDLTCAALISPAIDQITFEHHVSGIDLTKVLEGSPLIPYERMPIFIEGFRQGFAGNFLAANSILIPQVENSLRHLLESRGIVATKLESDLIQDEKDLNQLLDNPEFQYVFADDVVFNLKAILVSRNGANFRNRLSHGLLSPASFVSESASLFFFWIWLRLCAAQTITTQLQIAEKYQSEARRRLEEAIRERAYYLSIERTKNGVIGSSEDDWLSAERELIKQPINCAPA